MKPSGVFFLLLATAFFSSAQETPAPPPTAAERLESLDAEQLQKALDALRQSHVRGSVVDELRLKKATLRGLIDSLAPGAELVGG